MSILHVHVHVHVQYIRTSSLSLQPSWEETILFNEDLSLFTSHPHILFFELLDFPTNTSIFSSSNLWATARKQVSSLCLCCLFLHVLVLLYTCVTLTDSHLIVDCYVHLCMYNTCTYLFLLYITVLIWCHYVTCTYMYSTCICM